MAPLPPGSALVPNQVVSRRRPDAADHRGTEQERKTCAAPERSPGTMKGFVEAAGAVASDVLICSLRLYPHTHYKGHHRL